jgi:3-hydroxyisobutyrate dehydrogenase
MVAHLLKAGHSVTVWNRDAAKAVALTARGALIGASPRAAVRGADVVIAMLRDDPPSSDVWLDAQAGALSGMSVNSLAIECSTLSPGYVQQLAPLSAAAGVAFLDAPVIGSRPQADAAQLIFSVGGEVNALARAEPLLKPMGSTVYHVGPALLKLAANALFGIQVAALAEILGFLGKRGGDLARMIEVLGMTPVMSPSAKGARERNHRAVSERCTCDLDRKIPYDDCGTGCDGPDATGVLSRRVPHARTCHEPTRNPRPSGIRVSVLPG